MKKIDLKEKSSTYIIGRGLIIAVVLFTSSLGFILGYFVGRTTINETQSIRIPDDGSKNITKMPTEIISLQETLPQVSITAKKDSPQDKVNESFKENLTVNQMYPKPSKVVYTIQIGAFKNFSDAEAFKSKFDKKGFKSFVTDIKLKNSEKLYRVWIGEFHTRKEAEEVSLKLKKNEGLQPFITFKKGE